MAFFYRGQNLLDLALVIVIVGLVFVGMNVYVKRSIQGKVKNFTDYTISDKQSGEAPDAGMVESNTSFSSDATTESGEFKGGGRRSTGTVSTTYEYDTTSNPDDSINKP